MSPRIKETDIDIHTSRNNTEIDIHTKNRSRTPQPSSHNSSGSLSRRDNFYEEEIVYEQERDKLRVRDNQLSITRRRSVSARPPPQRFSGDLRETESEADFYARKVEERAYIGEAYNGATKDWAIVDVPPGTEKVRMDGVGGGAEEITWQRYNGVRRSKFIPSREPEPERERERIEIREERRIEDPSPRSSNLDIQIHSSSSRREGGAVFEREREYERIEESSDRRVGPPRGPKNRTGDLWTEITKDLVVADAITQLGYDFEETEFFFYVLQYLRYVRSPPFPLALLQPVQLKARLTTPQEDVLQLVQLSEQIRRERQDRIREIERERLRIERKEREREEWERAERRRPRDDGYEEERIIERDIIYDGRRPRRSGGWH
jgi:hypothetical protein